MSEPAYIVGRLTSDSKILFTASNYLKAIEMARVRILLADDHTLFCNLLRELLEPEYEVDRQRQ